MEDTNNENNELKIEKVSLVDIREMREREELIGYVNSLKQDKFFKETCKKYSEKNKKTN